MCLKRSHRTSYTDDWKGGVCVHKGRLRMVDHERKQQNYHIIHMQKYIENIIEMYKYQMIRYENAESSEKLVALLGEKSKNMKPSSARN